MVAILPLMLYQVARFGTLRFVEAKPANWTINIGSLRMIIVSYAGNWLGEY